MDQIWRFLIVKINHSGVMEEKIRAVDRAEDHEQHELEEVTDDKQAWDLAEKHER